MLARLFECLLFNQLSCPPPDAENQKSPNSRMLPEAGGHSHSTSYLWNLECTLQSDGKRTTLRLSGRIQSANVQELREQMKGDAERIVLDLEEVTLVRE